MILRRIVFGAAAAVLPLPAAAGANAGDTAWIIAASALVLPMTLPGLAIFVTVLRVSLLGVGLTDTLNPKPYGR